MLNAGTVSPDSKKVLLTSDQGVAYLYTINQDGFYTDKCEYKGMCVCVRFLFV